jgi:hypothetical protein
MHKAVPDSADTETLASVLAPELAPLFWRAQRVGVDSAWYAHLPFAHWIVAVAKPRVFVELGTHNGVSYSAFCESVVNCNLDTRCFAVDTWKGDEHSGFYSEEVYLDLSRFHDDRYQAFSNFSAADLTKRSPTSPIPRLIFCTSMVCTPTRQCAMTLRVGSRSCPQAESSCFTI